MTFHQETKFVSAPIEHASNQFLVINVHVFRSPSILAATGFQLLIQANCAKVPWFELAWFEQFSHGNERAVIRLPNVHGFRTKHLGWTWSQIGVISREK